MDTQPDPIRKLAVEAAAKVYSGSGGIMSSTNAEEAILQLCRRLETFMRGDRPWKPPSA